MSLLISLHQLSLTTDDDGDDSLVDGSDNFIDDEFHEGDDDELSLHGLDDDSDHDITIASPLSDHIRTNLCVVSAFP